MLWCLLDHPEACRIGACRRCGWNRKVRDMRRAAPWIVELRKTAVGKNGIRVPLRHKPALVLPESEKMS